MSDEQRESSAKGSADNGASAEVEVQRQWSHSESVAGICERTQQYMIKATREAKRHTSWTRPNEGYERAITDFVDRLLTVDGTGDGTGQASTFAQELSTFAQRLIRPGLWNSLGRTLLQFFVPGTPDLYQGDELWNFALVDPDNRRPVDYESRRRLLDEVVLATEADEESRDAFLKQVMQHPEDGRIKLYVIRTVLALRRQFPNLFTAGDYQPLAVSGSRADHVIASARADDSSVAIALTARWTLRMGNGIDALPIGHAIWKDTMVEVPEAWREFTWFNRLTHTSVSRVENRLALPVADILGRLPVALLWGTASGDD